MIPKNEILPNSTQEFVLKLIGKNKILDAGQIKNQWDEYLQEGKELLDAKIKEIRNNHIYIYI